MNTRTRSKTVLVIISMAIAAVALTPSANATPIVYEGFQYNNAAADSSEWGVTGDNVFPLAGEPNGSGAPTDIDATGLAGTWADPTSGDNDNMFLKSGSLSFGDLATSGNHIGFRSNIDNDRFNRALTADAQSSIDGADEIWFSVLVEKLQNDNSAAEGGFVLANQLVDAPKIPENDGTDGLIGFGVAPTTDGNNWTPYAWNGSSQTVGDGALSVGVGNGDIHLLVGHISFDTGSGGTDEYSLYDYILDGTSVVGGTLDPIASTLEVDVDQSELDIINLTRQVNLNYDELRIATTLNEVLGLTTTAVPEPSSVLLAVLGLLGLLGFGRWRKR